MKHFLVVIAATATIVLPALAADVGVSTNMGQPGYYGQIELGTLQRPSLLYDRPVVVKRAPKDTIIEPLYLRVPFSHAKNWRRYCGQYNACDHPAYFVKNDWYNNVYAPRYREQIREGRREDRYVARNDKGEKHAR
jgi:hypothetical protein